MFTVLSVTSAGTWSWIGAKLMIAHDPGRDHLIDDALRRGCGHRDDCDVHGALAIVLRHRFDGAHGEIRPSRGRSSPDRNRRAPTTRKPRCWNPSYCASAAPIFPDADDDDAPVALEAEDARACAA